MGLVTKTISKVTPTGSVDTYGNPSYNIECTDGTTGLWKGKKLAFWIIGKETTFNLEEKVGKSGRAYNNFSIPKEDRPTYTAANSSSGTYKKEKSPEEKNYSRRITALNAAISFKQHILVDKSIKDVQESCVSFLETKENSINAQAALKCAEKFLESDVFRNAILNKGTDEDRINLFIKQANRFYENIEMI